MYLHVNFLACTCACSVVSDFWDPMDCSPPGSSVHGIPQARIPEWVPISYSRESSDPGVQPESLASSASTGRPFTATKESLWISLGLSYLKFIWIHDSVDLWSLSILKYFQELFFCIFSVPHIFSVWNSSEKSFRSFAIALQIPEALNIFRSIFSLLCRLSKFYWSVFKLTDSILCHFHTIEIIMPLFNFGYLFRSIIFTWSLFIISISLLRLAFFFQKFQEDF